MYGIPGEAIPHILKYDPINDITSFIEIGKKANEDFCCRGDGVLGRDGCIYALTENTLVLKIDTTNISHCFVGKSDFCFFGWGNPILGIDGCIYWPPKCASRILKYDPHSNLASLVGDEFGIDDAAKWCGGCSASDGVIYCMPYEDNQILAIDPLKEYTLYLKKSIEEHPENLGCIFQPSYDIPNETNFDRAVTKFGRNKVLELLEDCMPPAEEVCAVSNLYPFMIAASYKNSDLFMVYSLARQAPSFANCIKQMSHSGSSDTIRANKKRKCDKI